MFRSLLALSILVPGIGLADLATAQAEKDLQKRSELAAENAEAAVERARQAYVDGRDPDFKKQLAEVNDSADLCYRSLQETGKVARKSPKYFKRAEAKLRSVMKRLDALAQETGIDDRPSVEAVKKHVNDVHDDILNAILTQKH